MSDSSSLINQSIQEAELREQDRWLPIANVSRLMKNTLPPTAKVSKDAKECMQECVSEFISFITSEASDRCLTEKRKTINGEDILYSMTSLGFENYSEVLKIYLAKYREQQALKQERGEIKKKQNSIAVAPAYYEYEDQEAQVSANPDFEPGTHNRYVQELYGEEYPDQATSGEARFGDNYDARYEQDQNGNGLGQLNNSHRDLNHEIQTINEELIKQEETVDNEATLSLNLNDNMASVVSESEELASLANGHHGENVLYRYQSDF
ncbi:unnamed protein product [Kuraishia capsulata CBS 1993]|uniref:Transcription factor CBF/NF-Y/archaeal histone domain-containing protein n=1 Tax=Kuraishia capsulata CBS 1993 TaxID=1382522 RepID=W6MXV5_9ASCO|nr:uncharacterized protein KUCA_T00005537001 [Kuraishia capsulata CBS 1993]CDK29545.1 unnamed protein product [Kuraishia capsulata CBS 1993]